MSRLTKSRVKVPSLEVDHASQLVRVRSNFTFHESIKREGTGFWTFEEVVVPFAEYIEQINKENEDLKVRVKELEESLGGVNNES